MSILSFPERGHWGKSSWRGNCSGYVYKELFTMLSPSSVCDPMVGGGTSADVAKEMGIEFYGLDLHSGFNILRDSISGTIGKEVDFCLSHPPYHSVLRYSGANCVWGDELGKDGHPDDLSRCNSPDDFMEKLHIAMLNQREATKVGGYYGIIIGDQRKNGEYYSYQSDAIARMPKSELQSVMIKTQHNCMSDKRSYGRMKMPFITHEYILLWKRSSSIGTLLHALSVMAKQQQNLLTSTWRTVVKCALIQLGGKCSLAELYNVVSKSAGDKIKSNEHWKAKVRQVLQLHSDIFSSSQRGVWELAA
ncbi:MAG: hypothetical protein QM500_19960 [Methylococcales bacterium]